MIPAYRIAKGMKYIFNEVAKSMNENLSKTSVSFQHLLIAHSGSAYPVVPGNETPSETEDVAWKRPLHHDHATGCIGDFSML